MQEDYPVKTDAYIRASVLNDYDGFCPVTLRDGYLNEDGSFRDEDLFQAEDVFLNPGFLVIVLGQVEAEAPLEQAGYALHASIQSMFADCGIPVMFERMRTFIELQKSIETFRGVCSHIVLIGHGEVDGIKFLDRDEFVSGAELAEIFECFEDCSPIQVISLCCHSGIQSIAGDISKAESVAEVIAPQAPFHVQWAVHFVSGYLLEFFLHGSTVDDAVAKAAFNPARTPMCVCGEMDVCRVRVALRLRQGLCRNLQRIIRLFQGC